MPSAPIGERAPSSGRDVRLDFFRGLALLFIFIDHVPGNVLGHWTLRSFGFSDAAEVFVLIAGFAAVLAFGPTFEKAGLLAGLRRIGGRIRELFAAHLLVLCIGAGGLALAAWAFENPLYFEHVNLTPFLYDPSTAIIQALLLLYQPSYMDILPLYIALLAWLPVLWLLMRIHLGLALAVSVGIWSLSAYGRVELPSYPTDSGWFFNPLAWQLLLSTGAMAAYAAQRGIALPRHWAFTALAATYVAMSCIAVAPWTWVAGLENTRVVPREYMPFISKHNMSLWRLGHVLALAYLAAVLVPRNARWLQSRIAGLVVDCGRNSLDIFCLGTLLSFAGFVVMLELGRGWETQIAVNLVGLAVLGWTGWWLTQRKNAKRLARQAALSAPAEGVGEPLTGRSTR